MKYTESELTEVARKMSLDRDLGDIMRAARGHRYVPGSDGWRDEVLRSAATWAGRSGSMRQILNALEASAMKEEIFTFAELEEYFQRRQVSRNGGAAQEARVVLQDIEAHREKLLDGRTYRSADGGYYQWDKDSESFRVFGEVAGVPRSLPERPLELLP